ncbi:MAG: hypothetical protein WCQ55_01150 [Paludibacteraceae bacterium]
MEFYFFLMGMVCLGQEFESDFYILTDVDTVRVGETFRVRYCSEVKPDRFQSPDLSLFEMVREGHVRELKMEGDYNGTVYALCYDLKLDSAGTFVLPPTSIFVDGKEITCSSKKIVSVGLDSAFHFKYTMELEPRIPTTGMTFRLVLKMNAKPSQTPYPDLWNLSIVKQTSGTETVDGVTSYFYVYYLETDKVQEHEILPFEIAIGNRKYKTDRLTFEVKNY